MHFTKEILCFSIFNFVCQYYEKSDFQGSQLVLLKHSFFDSAYVLVDSLRFTRTGRNNIKILV